MHPSQRVVSRTLSIAIITLLSTSASADVTIEERLSVEGAGLMRMANMTGRTVTTISGQRARTESEMQMQSRLVRAFAPGPAAEIVRLDEDKVYSLELKKKRYTETSLADLRAQMQSSMDEMQQAQEQQQQSTSGVDESQCEWLPPKVDILRPGEKANIAGFEAERVIINAVQSCQVKNSAQVCDFGLSLDQWVAPEFDGGAEAVAYQRAYAEKMGFDAAGSRDFAERAQAMFGRYQDMWKEVGEKMAEVQGYPVKSSFGMGIGGPSCQDLQQAPNDQEHSSGVGGMAGQIGGAIGGLFKKKKAEPEQPSAVATAAALPNGLIPLMTVSSELVSVSHDTVSPQTFEVPADFKKVAKE